MPAAAEARRGRLARQEVRPRLLRLRPGGRRSPRLTADVALAIVLREGTVLIARRADDQHLGGAWEFPGGKVEPGEEPLAAALRELREETALAATDAEPLLVFVHDYPDRRLRFHAFLVKDATGEPRTDGGRPWAFAPLAALGDVPMPEANRAILRALRWRLG